MAERKWVEEMDDIIERHTNVPTYQTRIVAQDIVSYLLANDPDLLHGWLRIRAADLLHEVINRRDRSRRARGAIQRKLKNFNDTLEEFVAGNEQPVRSFLSAPYVINQENDRKYLRDMNREDLVYVADEYSNRAAANTALAALHYAMAKRVGEKTVGEVFTDQQIIELREAMLGPDTPDPSAYTD
jgi:hypothetical protein